MDNDGISIVLVGAPGSRKSEVAEEFNKLSQKSALGYFQVIDRVATEIESVFDRPMGVFGTYVENLWVAMLRYEEEAHNRKTGNPFITVGSIIETMAHGAQNVELLATGVQTPESQKRIQREMHATTTLSFLFLDTFRYTYGFYIPLPERIELPANVKTEDDDSYRYAIDRNIQTVFTNFGLGLESLTGTVEEMAQKMLDSILKLEEQKSAQVEEPVAVESEA